MAVVPAIEPALETREFPEVKPALILAETPSTEESVGPRLLPVHTKFAECAGAIPGYLGALGFDPGRQGNKILEASTIQGNIGDELLVERCTDRRVGHVEDKAAGVNGY